MQGQGSRLILTGKVHIAEIFSSIQGEGMLVGVRQIFVRFGPCNIMCTYCDTPVDEADLKECIVERTPGRKDFEKLPNPVDIKTLNDIILSLKGSEGLHHSISLTGGEPLLQVDFLKSWLPGLKKDFRIYLETNGTLYEELKEIIDLVDIVSMDIKLPKTAGIGPRWEDHYWFLKAAMKKRVFVKIVVSADTTSGEFIKGAQMVGGLDRDIPLIIQPVTATRSYDAAVSQDRLLEFHRIASGFVNQVRVIPQTHKLMGML